MRTRRRQIANELVTQLKKINGGISTFNSSYTYTTNIFNNIFRRLKFLDEVNDFPSIYLQVGDESRIFHSDDVAEAELEVVIRCYVKSGTPTQDLEDLAIDIEHVLENQQLSSSLGVLDITINSVSNDEGLVSPFGIGEVFVTVSYELAK